jgi:hypothetical protein
VNQITFFFADWTSFMLTWEMVVISALATYLLRPSKTVFFDRHPRCMPRVATSAALPIAVSEEDGNNNNSNTLPTSANSDGSGEKIKQCSDLKFDRF